MKKKRKEPVYSITDIEQYAIFLREQAASSFTSEYSENLDDFISIKQITNIIAKHSISKDEDNNFLITSSSFDNIFDDIRNWIYGVGLAKLAAKGSVECAWDNDANEMVFWLADTNNTPLPNKPSDEK